MATVNSLSSSLSSSNQMRISGLVSGIDTDTVVKSLVASRQLKADKMSQSLQLTQWKKDAYTDINNQLRVFREKYMSVLSSDSMLSKASYAKYNVTNSDSAYVGITAVGSAANASHTMSVQQLATAAGAESASKLEYGTNSSKTISSAQMKGKISANFPQLTTSADENNHLQRISFSINGERFDFTSDDSLESIMTKVNSSGAGVTLSYSEATDKFSINANVMGSSDDPKVKDFVEIKNINGNFFGDSSFTNIKADKYENGKNAKFTLDGVEIVRDSNKFTIDNISYNLKKVTGENKEIDFSLERDLDATINKIKDFVNSYNDLMSSLTNTISEKKNKNYAPLTDAQRSAMEDKDIEKWEKLAKSGILRNDSDVMGLRDSLRSMFSDNINGLGALSSIGISTDNYFSATMDGGYAGKIVIDETKLRQALTENPDKVISMLSSAPSESDFKSTQKEGGLVQRMTSMFDEYSNKMRETNFKTLNYAISDTTSRLTDEYKKIDSYQAQLYAKFSAMETALQNMQSQSNWFAQQLGQ